MNERKEELKPVFTWGQREDQTCWASLEIGLYHNQGDVQLHPTTLTVIEMAFRDAEQNARLTKQVAELEEEREAYYSGAPMKLSERAQKARESAIRMAAKARKENEEEFETLRVYRRCIPNGAKLAEAYETERYVVVMADGPMGEDHNCDQMGCGTLSHVAFRFFKQPLLSTPNQEAGK